MLKDTIRRDLKGAFTVWYRDILRFFTDKARIIGSLGQPLLFLFIFGGGIASAMSGLGGGAFDFKQFMYPGIIGMSVLFTAVFSAMSIVWDREFGFLKEVLVAPVSRTSVAFGKVAGGASVATFQGAIILILAPMIGIKLTLVQVVWLLLIMLLTAAMMTAFGILLAARQKSTEGFQVIMQFLLMPMLFLSGAFFPLTDIPLWMEILAKLDPVTYGVDALRQVTLSESVPAKAIEAISIAPLHVDIAIMSVVFVAFLIPAVLLFSKQD